LTIPLPRASLRTYLLALTAGVVISVLCFAAYLIIGLSRIQQEAVERGLTETVRALASGVDRELMSSITALEALATSEYLDRADYDAFAREAQRVLRSQAQHGWLTIHLASPDGTPLMNSLAPGGAPPPIQEVATVTQTAALAKPVISDLLPDAVRDERAFAVRVPVVRDGGVRYVLSAILAGRSMGGALSSQQDVPDRIAVLYDRRNTIVFRTVNAASPLIHASSPRSSPALPDVGPSNTSLARRHVRHVSELPVPVIADIPL
jgi:hypothetical protein